MPKRVLVATLLLVSALAAGSLRLTLPGTGETFARAQLYDRFGCGGENLSPALGWEGAPKGTKSFALTMHDPDAPRPGGWWHWFVANLPADARGLPEGAGTPGAGRLPAGAVQLRNDFGETGYGGPCPPRGDAPHRYVLTLYALDTAIPLSPDTPPAEALRVLRPHVLEQVSVVVPFGRRR